MPLAADIARSAPPSTIVRRLIAFALQCMSTVAIVRRETGGWKWPILQFTYMGVLAYIGAFVAYHLIS